MLRKRVKLLRKGDQVLIETHFGELVLKDVIRVDKYAVYVKLQSFSKKSGWELVRGIDGGRSHQTAEGKMLRDRIHTGDGILFTEEDQEKYQQLTAPYYEQLELLLKIQNTPTGVWLSLPRDKLEQIEKIIYGTTNET